MSRKNYYTTYEELMSNDKGWARATVTVSFERDGEEKRHFTVEADINGDHAYPVSVLSNNMLATMQIKQFIDWLFTGLSHHEI